MAAVQTWIDSFGETVKFKYDEEGFPVMPEYDELNEASDEVLKGGFYEYRRVLQTDAYHERSS